MFVAGCRHALRSEWPFIIINTGFYYFLLPYYYYSFKFLLLLLLYEWYNSASSLHSLEVDQASQGELEELLEQLGSVSKEGWQMDNQSQLWLWLQTAACVWWGVSICVS